jgi:putative membrane protein
MKSVAKLEERTLYQVIAVITLVVSALVTFLILFPQALQFGDFDVSLLPALNATINSICSLLLITGFVLIRQGQKDLHKIVMTATLILSALFLVSYVIYHSQAPATRFGGEGLIRTFYFIILISHIILAVVILPLALFTIARAWRGEFGRHKKLARYTFPIWLYVTVTGVIVYLMISPYYQH